MEQPEQKFVRINAVWGGDIGLNVWVENGDLLIYVGRSGTFDHNNTVLKLGRVRLKLSPNPFEAEATFRQELVLNKGHVDISAAGQDSRQKLPFGSMYFGLLFMST